MSNDALREALFELVEVVMRESPEVRLRVAARLSAAETALATATAVQPEPVAFGRPGAGRALAAWGEYPDTRYRPDQVFNVPLFVAPIAQPEPALPEQAPTLEPGEKFAGDQLGRHLLRNGIPDKRTPEQLLYGQNALPEQTPEQVAMPADISRALSANLDALYGPLPEQAGGALTALRKALVAAVFVLDKVRVFVTSRERINDPAGTQWFDEEVESFREVLARDALTARATPAADVRDAPEPPTVPSWIDMESGPDSWLIGWNAGYRAAIAKETP